MPGFCLIQEAMNEAKYSTVLSDILKIKWTYINNDNVPSQETT